MKKLGLLFVTFALVGGGCFNQGASTSDYSDIRHVDDDPKALAPYDIYEGSTEIVTEYEFVVLRGTTCLNPKGAERDKLPETPEQICLSNNSVAVQELGAPANDEGINDGDFKGQARLLIGNIKRYDNALGVVYTTKLLEVK